MDYTEAEKILSSYSIEQILEYNELTEAELIQYLVDVEFIQLPEVLPVDASL